MGALNPPCRRLLSVKLLIVGTRDHSCHPTPIPRTHTRRLSSPPSVQSVLEMYHTCTAFEILRRPDCNIIAALTRDEYKEFRSLCIKSILATDLQRHVEIVSKFDAIVANVRSFVFGVVLCRWLFRVVVVVAIVVVVVVVVVVVCLLLFASFVWCGNVHSFQPPFHPCSPKISVFLFVLSRGPLSHAHKRTHAPTPLPTPLPKNTKKKQFNKNALEDRALLLQVVIKAADISNPLRPFMIARLWSDMIIEEGFRQGEKEAQLGLPISPFMDRHTCNQAKMSVGFLDFLVIPLYDDRPGRVFRRKRGWGKGGVGGWRGESLRCWSTACFGILVFSRCRRDTMYSNPANPHL